MPDQAKDVKQTAQAIDVVFDRVVGRIAAPFGSEATAKEFHFWVKRGQLIEENQFVFTESEIGGERVRFYGVIDLLKRGSRKPTISEEFDMFDGDVTFQPPFAPDGVTSARVQILAAKPEFDLPPIEHSPVSLGGEEEARIAYGFDDQNKPWMQVGILKNGQKSAAGLGLIDLDYLLGENGGHLNVNGVAGVGTKTTFLLTVLKSLQQKAEQSRQTNRPLTIVPIILNVKAEDLMWLNKANNRFTDKETEDWKTLGIEPAPFENATFFVPEGKPVHGCDASGYSWSFHDVFREESLLYIFSDEDDLSGNMITLVREFVADFTELDGKTPLATAPDNWQGFLDWMRTTEPDRRFGIGTWWAVYRRLLKVLDEGKDILPRREINGNPLRVVRAETTPPQVVDINSLPQSLQRFVVGSILNQVVAARKSAKAVRGLRYIIMLDELNRFAPKGSRDEITRLLEKVASEMRSQGVILLGAQQMASQVSTKVIEMSSIRVLGRTGAAELADKVWSAWEKPMREKAARLQASEKLILQPTFRQPMLVALPLNPWADKRDNVKRMELDRDNLPEI